MIFDAWAFLSSAPHWLVYLFGLCFLLLGGWLLVRFINQAKSLVNTVESLALIKQSLEDHVEKTEIHFKDTERIADEDVWKRCNISHCSQMQQLFGKVDKLNDRFDQFDRRADETRSNTTTSLDGLRDGQKELGKDLGRELGDLAKMIIGVLSEDLKRRER